MLVARLVLKSYGNICCQLGESRGRHAAVDVPWSTYCGPQLSLLCMKFKLLSCGCRLITFGRLGLEERVIDQLFGFALSMFMLGPPVVVSIWWLFWGMASFGVSCRLSLPLTSWSMGAVPLVCWSIFMVVFSFHVYLNLFAAGSHKFFGCSF